MLDQCRLNHGPNGPLARAPELQGPRAAGQRSFLIVEFGRQNIDWLSGFNLASFHKLFKDSPVSTEIWPHSLPERAFTARPGLGRICLCPKVARIAEHKFANR